MKNYYKIIDDIRKEIVDQIVELVKLGEEDELFISEFSPGESPLLKEGLDDSDTFTLDSLILTEKGLEFNGSSNWTNISLREEDVSMDNLINILEFLDAYKEDIKELNNGI